MLITRKVITKTPKYLWKPVNGHYLGTVRKKDIYWDDSLNSIMAVTGNHKRFYSFIFDNNKFICNCRFADIFKEVYFLLISSNTVDFKDEGNNMMRGLYVD